MFSTLLCYLLSAMMRTKNIYLHIVIKVRTNIVIDDKLKDDALKATGIATKKEAVEQGLKLLIRHNKQQAIWIDYINGNTTKHADKLDSCLIEGSRVLRACPTIG